MFSCVRCIREWADEIATHRVSGNAAVNNARATNSARSEMGARQSVPRTRASRQANSSSAAAGLSYRSNNHVRWENSADIDRSVGGDSCDIDISNSSYQVYHILCAKCVSIYPMISRSILPETHLRRRNKGDQTSWCR